MPCAVLKRYMVCFSWNRKTFGRGRACFGNWNFVWSTHSQSLGGSHLCHLAPDYAFGSYKILEKVQNGKHPSPF